MKRSPVFAFAVLAAALAAGACADGTQSTAVQAPDGAPAYSSAPTETGNHVVEFSADAVPAGFAARVAQLGGTVVNTWGGAGIAVVSGLSPQGVAQLAASSGVSYVQPDVRIRGVEPTVGTATAASVGANSPTFPNTAFFYARQWNMRAVGADVAWAAGYLGSPGVKVAILDTGIDYEHPDLAGRVDLASSASFVPSDDSLVAEYFPGKHPVTDLQYHGTHVAATVASNAVAAAGVTSQTTLIGVKVLAVDGYGSFSAILAGIIWAADHDADVINMSLGGYFDRREARDLVRAIRSASRYARKQGALIVVSAGNDAIDLDNNGTEYAAFCDAPHVVCVSATGPTASGGTNGPWTNVDALASYSNYGRHSISVAAPGGTGFGYVSAACSSTSLVIPVCQTGSYVIGLAGTSQAAPHVSGLAALLVAQRGHGKPNQVRNEIRRGTDNVGPREYFGRGRINVPETLGL
ncbi:S8 family serine peptidase [Longimicrobium sp.]|uniref:S8 family serine peptidase n=1 Tax=Longimicrobium sp. TaxID=2029185 RepID=UPI003B3B8200